MSRQESAFSYEVSKILAKLALLDLPLGVVSRINLPSGRGFLLVKKKTDETFEYSVVIGGKKVENEQRESSSQTKNASTSGDGFTNYDIPLRKGDVILTTPKKDKGMSAGLKIPTNIFKKVSTSLQGSHGHSAIYVGNGQVVEARIEDGVQIRPLKRALRGIDSAIVVRPKTDKRTREGAADFAVTRVGRQYDNLAFLTAQGASMLIPDKMSKKLISRKQNPQDADKFICGNLVAASYASKGFSPKGSKYWDLTVPRDFLDPGTNRKIGIIGKKNSVDATIGKFKGQEKISSQPSLRLFLLEKISRAPRDYKREYEQYHAKPEQVENRSLRNQARRKLGLKKGDPREADHKTPLSKGGGNGHSNLRAVSRKTNRTKFTDPS